MELLDPCRSYKTGRICVRMFLGIQKSPREIIQCLVLILRAHQIVNEKTLTLNKSSTSGEKQNSREGGREGGFNSSSQIKSSNTEMFSASLSKKL